MKRAFTIDLLSIIFLAQCHRQSSRQAHLETHVSADQAQDSELYLQITDCGCPGGRNGNEDASTTLRPRTPYTRACESITAIALSRVPMAPNLKVSLASIDEAIKKEKLTSTRRMINSRHALPHILLQLSISRNILTRRHLIADQDRLNSLCSEEVATSLHSCDRHLHIDRIRQPTNINDRRICHIVGGQGNVAFRLRSYQRSLNEAASSAADDLFIVSF